MGPQYGQAGAQDAALLADFGMSSSQRYYPSMAPLPEFYGNFLHHDNKIPPQSSSPTSVNFHWHTAAAPCSRSSTNQHNVPQASSSMNSHPGPLSFLDSPHGLLHPSDAINRGQQVQAAAAASNSNSSSPEVDLTEAERAAEPDEKRRRNTAASGTSLFFTMSDRLIFVGAARFRVKKKHKTIALERAVSDLTGRAEELEREVGDLRQENGWLKEIVMLKGTQNVANNRLALRQAVAFAAGQRSYSTESTVQEDVSEGSSSALSDDDIPVKQSKGKQRSNKKS